MIYGIKYFFKTILLKFSKGVMSDRDIKRLLGYHIFIYPFNEKNLNASSYNLTASSYAFIKEKDYNTGEEKQKLIVNGDRIIIPKHKTAIIETNECIYVSNRIAGTYHSKVKVANKGLGHIGTTLDPCYCGTSAIALHNISDEPIVINVGDTIVTLMFYSLCSKSSGRHDNMPGRVDNITLDSKEFYKFDKEEFIKLDLKKKYSKLNCNSCGKKENCKLVEDKEKCCEEKTLAKIKEWKENECIINKDDLIDKVKKEIQFRKDDKTNWGKIAVYVAVLGIIVSIIIAVITLNGGNK